MPNPVTGKMYDIVIDQYGDFRLDDYILWFVIQDVVDRPGTFGELLLACDVWQKTYGILADGDGIKYGDLLLGYVNRGRIVGHLTPEQLKSRIQPEAHPNAV